MSHVSLPCRLQTLSVHCAHLSTILLVFVLQRLSRAILLLKTHYFCHYCTLRFTSSSKWHILDVYMTIYARPRCTCLSFSMLLHLFRIYAFIFTVSIRWHAHGISWGHHKSWWLHRCTHAYTSEMSRCREPLSWSPLHTWVYAMKFDAMRVVISSRPDSRMWCPHEIGRENWAWVISTCGFLKLPPEKKGVLTFRNSVPRGGHLVIVVEFYFFLKNIVVVPEPATCRFTPTEC